MDAVEFIKARDRMMRDKGQAPNVEYGRKRSAEEVVSIVERWAKEHPIKTRQSEFLKQFPNAPVYTDMHTVALNPCLVDTTLQGHCPKGGRCDDCRREFWMQEVE